MLALEQTGENSCLVMSDEPWICQRGSSASPGASATHFLWNPRVLPLHLCVAACGRPAQSSLWRKFFINSPVRSAGLELAPGLVTCNPIVCFFASSWSRVPGSFPDRQATYGRPRLLQGMAPASPLSQPSWTGALSSRGPGVGHLPFGGDLSFWPFLRPASGVVLIYCCPGPVCRD